jgi:hypothetical protein
MIESQGQVNRLQTPRSLLSLSPEIEIFQGGRKTKEPGEKPSWQGREPTTNSTHMKYPRVEPTTHWDHSGERRA